MKNPLISHWIILKECCWVKDGDNQKAGWTRSKFLPPGRGSTAGNYPNYKGKKNPYCSDLKPLKYFNCKWDNDQKCSCPCVYHLLTIVLIKRREESQKSKAEFGLCMQMNTPSLEDTFLIEQKLKINTISSTLQEP